MSRGSGCLLVGSVPLQDAETVFRRAEQALPRRLLYIPDGETGNRGRPPSEEQLAVLTKHFEENEIRTGYEDAAIQSYGVFKTLKTQGVIPPSTKFQVGLPTIANVIGAQIRPGVQKIAAPCYEKALFNAISRIQENIPHDELAIQIDMGMDLACWEDVHMTEPFWNDVQWSVWFDTRLYVVEYIARDRNHKHFKEPESLSSIVELYTKIRETCSRRVQWMHCPVPQSAMSKLDSYYAPLAKLASVLNDDDTKLYLGLVHADDLHGTYERIAAAKSVVEDFGVGTECGLGRTPAAEIDNILNIMQEVSNPV
ncbi:hypothetical protein PWT90_05342 [Aphanocladium album]|nr:hypothetical protein PWT90_05342 [Aphanocladium album]